MGEIIMNKSLIAFSCIVALFLGVNVYAQDIEMTPYEQKREQLITEAMEKLMNTMTAYDKALFSVNLMNALREAHEEGDRFQEMAISENILFKFCELGEGLQTEANLLAGSLDISDVYTGQSLQEWKAIGQWYKQERIKLDKTKTEEDIQRERDRAALSQNQTGIPGIKQRVKKEFLKWAKKGQFEKTIAYNERMSQKGIEVFDSLCFVHFNEMINKEVGQTIDKDNYDADRERINMRFYYGERGYEESYVDAFWYVTPQQLRDVDGVDWEQSFSKGLFRKNGYLFPATYHFVMTTSGWSTRNKAWDIVFGKPESVTLTVEEVIGSNAPIDISHVFDYSQYSTSLMLHDDLVQKVWDYFQHQDNDYLKKNDSGIGNFPYMQGGKYKELFPEGKEFFTKEQVERILQRIAAEKAQKDKELETIARINSFFKDVPVRMIAVNGDRYLSDDELIKEVNSFLDNMDEKQRGDYLAKELSDDPEISSILAQYTSASNSPYELQDVLRIIKRIDNNSSKYHIDMVPIYSYVIEAAPYYSKKYRKGTPEEKTEKFRNSVMSNVVIDK